MTLAQVAHAAGTDRKGIANADRALGRRIPRTREGAGQLGIAREIAGATNVSLHDAWPVAGTALATTGTACAVLLPGSPAGVVTFMLDLDFYRQLARARWSAAVHFFPANLRGRPLRRRGSAVSRARTFGVDLSLVGASLRRSAPARLSAASDNMAFAIAFARP